MGWKFSFRAWCWSQARLGVDFKVLIVISFFVLIPSNPRCWLIPRFYLFVFIAWCWFQANPMGLFLGSITFFFLIYTFQTHVLLQTSLSCIKKLCQRKLRRTYCACIFIQKEKYIFDSFNNISLSSFFIGNIFFKLYKFFLYCIINWKKIWSIHNFLFLVI